MGHINWNRMGREIEAALVRQVATKSSSLPMPYIIKCRLASPPSQFLFAENNSITEFCFLLFLLADFNVSATPATLS